MAKGSIALGRFRGKAGGFVFRTDSEVGQIISVKPEHVKNPRTLAQTNQRNKMNMAGQLSKMTPYEAIAGLGGGRRFARSKFVSNVLLNATVSAGTDPNEKKADVNWSKLLFSRGLVTYPAVTKTLGDSTPSITVEANLSNLGATPMGMIVVAYPCVGGIIMGCHMGSTNTVSQAGVASVTITFPGNLSDYENDGGVAVYVIPMFDTGADARTAYGALIDGVTGGGGQGPMTTVVRTLVATNAYGASYYAGMERWE